MEQLILSMHGDIRQLQVALLIVVATLVGLYLGKKL